MGSPDTVIGSCFVGHLKKDLASPIDLSQMRFASPNIDPIVTRFRLQFLTAGMMDGYDRNPVEEKRMSTNTIESEQNALTDAPKPKRKRVAAKKAKPAKKAVTATKPVTKANAERANKKAEGVGLMKRAKGATLAEIMKATGWQAHTVRGFVSLLGSKGGEKIESSKNDAGERTYRIAR